MTGGKVVVLGEVGQNFGAGMTGGMAFIYDPQDSFLTVPIPKPCILAVSSIHIGTRCCVI